MTKLRRARLWNTKPATLWICFTPTNMRSLASLYARLSSLTSLPPTPVQLNYHLYTHPVPDSLQSRYFASDTLREDLQKRSEAVHTAPPPGLGLPDETQGYHSLVPLEATVGERRKFGNWHSTVYKAINSSDGFAYSLRRIESMETFLVISSILTIVQIIG